MLVDSHAHIDGEEYDADRDEVIERARAAGVRFILNVGTGDPQSGSLERAVRVAEQYEGVYAAVGVHPHDAKLFDAAAEQRLAKLVGESERVIAWGEIGLDYHYDHSPREVQREVFKRQLKLAREAGLPVIIHSRAADEETVDILREHWQGAARGGVMHCFGGGVWMAEQVLEIGFMISFAGNVTFKKAENLREMARLVPLERLLIETDCPYLTPVPFRGRRNEPARVAEVARCLADVRGMQADEIGRITSAKGDQVPEAGPLGQHSAGAAVLLGQIQHGDATADRARQRPGRSADPAAHVEHAHLGPDSDQIRQLDCRSSAARVELVDRCEVARSDRVDDLAVGADAVSNCVVGRVSEGMASSSAMVGWTVSNHQNPHTAEHVRHDDCIACAPFSDGADRSARASDLSKVW